MCICPTWAAPDLEQWMREYYSQSQKKALIGDVRYNGGGNIAEWILLRAGSPSVDMGKRRGTDRLSHRPKSAFLRDR